MSDPHAFHHLAWLWLWFAIGMGAYMLSRAYYLVTGPLKIARSYGELVRIAWIPLGVRALVDSGFYWATFTPQVLKAALDYLGWGTAAGIVNVVTQFGVCALFFGFGIDHFVDIGISKVPIIKDWLPQMPPPLNPPPPADKP